MRSRFHHFLLFVILQSLASTVNAAWPVDLPAQEEALEKWKARLGKQWVVGREAGRIISLTGRASKIRHLSPGEQVAEVAERAAALRGLKMEDFDRRVVLPPTPDTLRFQYQQKYGDETVENALIVINYDRRTSEVDVLLNAIPPRLAVPGILRDDEHTLRIAKRALIRELQEELVPGTTLSRYDDAERRCGGKLPEPVARIDGPAGRLLAFDGRLTRVSRVVTKLVGPEACRETIVGWRDYDVNVGPPDGGINPYAYDVDPYAYDDEGSVEGEIVRMTNRIQYACGRGRVFDPNPRNARIAPFQGAVPETFPPYKKVRLPGLARTAAGHFLLEGATTRIVDRNGSNAAGITVTGRPDFSAFAGNEQFAAVMAFYHVQRLQTHARRLGFGAYQHMPLDIDVDNGTTQYNTPDQTEGHPFLSFGQEHAVFHAEDADVIAHEYAHMLLGLGGRGRFAIAYGEAAAMNEGFSDYWAMSSFVKQTLRNKHKLACFAEWIAGSGSCVRRLDEKFSYDQFDYGEDEHENGKIWSAVLYRLFLTLGSKRNAVERLLLKAHINRAPLGDMPTMPSIAEGIAIAARRRDKEKVCKVLEDFDLDVPYCTQWLRPQ